MNKIFLTLLYIFIFIIPASALNLSKNWDGENKTLEIYNNENLAAKLKLISATSDITTFEEILELTAYTNYTFDNLKDFKTRWNVIKGKNNITKSEWYIYKNVSYEITVDDYELVQHNQIIPNITSYTNITNSWNFMINPVDVGVVNSKLKYKFNFSYNDTNYTNIVGGFDYWDVMTPNPLKVKIFWNQTDQIGSHTEIRYKYDWVKFNLSGKSMVDGNLYLFKLIYYKNAELGNINIQTLPMFMGFEEQNLTWWNSSWSYSVHNTITNGTRPYQISLNISNSTGTNNATHIYCNGNCNINFTDIRFTLDNTTSLPYWIENNSTDGKVWINVTANGTVNSYYGNPDATTTSNGTNTFILFNDFTSDMNGWTSVDSVSISGGKLVSAGTGLVAGYAGDTAYTDYIFEGTRQYFTYYEGLIFRRTSNSAYYLIWTNNWDGTKNLWLELSKFNPGRVDLFTNTTYTTFRNTDYKFKIVVSGSNIKYYDTTGTENLIIDFNDSTFPSGNIGFGRIVVGSFSGNLDNTRVRRFASPEPVWSTWGAETQQEQIEVVQISYLKRYIIWYD